MLWRTNVWEAANINSENISEGLVANTFPFRMQTPIDSAVWLLNIYHMYIF